MKARISATVDPALKERWINYLDKHDKNGSAILRRLILEYLDKNQFKVTRLFK